MKNRWFLQTEKGDHQTGAVWVAVEERNGKKTTAVVLETSSRAAMIILESGMFYLTGQGMTKPVLFRIENCTRARIEGCMFIKAIETADTVRLRENGILREMRKLLELDMIEVVKGSPDIRVIQTVAS